MYSFHVPITTVHDTPEESSECVTEGLMGEDYSILEDIDDSWLKITLQRDNYTGYIKRPSAISQLYTNYRVCSRTTLLFAAPSIKSRIVWRIPFNAQLEIVESKETDFKATADGVFVWHTHVCPVSTVDKRSPIKLAESCFLNAPYLWGGRTPSGVDCSGMVQSVFQACGYPLPRDSHQQEISIETLASHEQRQRGDLVFWPGHVGLLISPTELLHATAHTLDCRVEPLAQVIQRAGDISSIRRPINPD